MVFIYYRTNYRYILLSHLTHTNYYEASLHCIRNPIEVSKQLIKNIRPTKFGLKNLATHRSRLLSCTVGRYRRVVGCNRRKVSTLENTRSGAFKAVQNTKQEKYENLYFSENYRTK